jgi:Fe-S-cluster containining protein
MKEESKYLIQEYKEQQEHKERWESNHIDFNDYFKYSGEIEQSKILITRYVYNNNSRCNELHQKYINKEHYEKLWKDKAGKSYPGRFTQEIEAHCWDETEDSVWCDKD